MTANAALDGRIEWSGNFASLVAAFPNGPGAQAWAPTTDSGVCFWNATAKAWQPIGNASPYGIVENQLIRWRPSQGSTPGTLQKSITFTAALAAGATSGTLNGNWGGLTGLWPVTLSTGQIVHGYLTNGATTCPFFPYPTPTPGGTYGAAQAVTAAATTAATVAAQPPVVGVSNYYAVSASIAAGAAAVLAASAADVPRNVVGAWTTSSTVTVTGTDYYGNVQTEAQTGTSFTGKKAFATITSIVSSASITLSTFGTGNVLGLPFRIGTGDLSSMIFNDAADAGTIVLADTTSPATSSTGDVRGTYAPAGTLNGAKILSAILKAYDPKTQVGTLGVTPV